MELGRKYKEAAGRIASRLKRRPTSADQDFVFQEIISLKLKEQMATQAENEKLSRELEDVKRENEALRQIIADSSGPIRRMGD